MLLPQNIQILHGYPSARHLRVEFCCSIFGGYFVYIKILTDTHVHVYVNVYYMCIMYISDISIAPLPKNNQVWALCPRSCWCLHVILPKPLCRRRERLRDTCGLLGFRSSQAKLVSCVTQILYLQNYSILKYFECWVLECFRNCHFWNQQGGLETAHTVYTSPNPLPLADLLTMENSSRTSMCNQTILRLC